MNEQLAGLMPASAREFDLACRLQEAGFLTESGLRLGRAVEAGLYAVARELVLPLTDTVVREIEHLCSGLREKGHEIMRGPEDASKVRQLADVSKNLSEAIAYLVEYPERRKGVPRDAPRRSEALAREMIKLVPEVSLKAQLGRQKLVLRDIQDARNNTAHADIDGGARELSTDEYQKLRKDVEEYLLTLCKVMIGIRASKEEDREANGGRRPTTSNSERTR